MSQTIDPVTCVLIARFTRGRGPGLIDFSAGSDAYEVESAQNLVLYLDWFLDECLTMVWSRLRRS
jgi:hypothetical protein